MLSLGQLVFKPKNQRKKLSRTALAHSRETGEVRPGYFHMRFFFPSLAFVFAAQTLLAQSGSVDPAFDPGTGVDLAVFWITPQANGQILIGGDFTSFDDVERINIARLNANGSRDDGFDPGTALDGPFPYVNSIAVQPGSKILVAGSFTNSVAERKRNVESKVC